MSSTGVGMPLVKEPHEVTRLEFWPMSEEEYLALPEGLHAEYVDGEAVVSPPPTSGHNTAQRRIANAIEAGLSDEVDVRTEAGWGARAHCRVPDVAVFTNKDDVVFDASTPILVVDVLSPSTRVEDQVRKAAEYLAAGVGQYWIVDRDEPSLLVHVNEDGTWHRPVVLDAEHPTATVGVGDWGEVALDLAALLRR